MRVLSNVWLAGCAVAALAAAPAAQAVDAPAWRSAPAVRPILSAMSHGDCTAAVKAGNEGVVSGEAPAVFVLGRMVNEGICTAQDRNAAASYFARASALGDHGSALDFATKVGLGEGVEQSYERAGEVCRVAGVDPQGRVSRYARGYACTLGGLTAELLRTTLPRGALQPGIALVDFTPSSGVMEVRSVPRAHISEADTGTKVHRATVDPAAALTRAWAKALARAPKPDATILDKLTIEVPIDLDSTLETAAARISVKSDVLQLGQAFPGSMRLPSSMGPGH